MNDPVQTFIRKHWRGIYNWKPRPVQRPHIHGTLVTGRGPKTYNPYTLDLPAFYPPVYGLSGGFVNPVAFYNTAGKLFTAFPGSKTGIITKPNLVYFDSTQDSTLMANYPVVGAVGKTTTLTIIQYAILDNTGNGSSFYRLADTATVSGQFEPAISKREYNVDAIFAVAGVGGVGSQSIQGPSLTSTPTPYIIRAQFAPTGFSLYVNGTFYGSLAYGAPVTSYNNSAPGYFTIGGSIYNNTLYWPVTGNLGITMFSALQLTTAQIANAENFLSTFYA